MNIRCPQCQAVFRVDPEKIPATGVKARCARCTAIFSLNRNGLVPAPWPEPGAAAAPLPAAAPASAPPLASTPSSAPPASAAAATAPASAASTTPPPPAAAPARELPGRAAPPPNIPLPQRDATAATPRPRPTFGKQDPNTRANRIARALVSDIVAYNRERRDQTLEAGTLKLEFREEIRKSWEEYVEQVGLELARSTPYFRDALNAILANGKPVF